jgi:hypothetical protein
MNRRRLLTHGPALTATALSLPGLTLLTSAAEAAEVDETDVNLHPSPKGALLLFDGKSLDQWVNRNGGGPAGWKLENGFVEVVKGNGDIITKELFTDYQLHVEFWLPFAPELKGQERSNSGVYNQGRIEVQVLDSYGEPPRDNEAGGIYKVAVPIRNASKKPAHWQSYDIAYRAPKVGDDGQQTAKGSITVFHNGLLIHNNVEFDAQVTTSGLPGDLSKPGPILLQDHGNPIRFRNIWILPDK